MINFKEWKKFLKDAFFPKFCLGCQTEGEFLCFNCRRKEIEKIKERGLILLDWRLKRIKEPMSLDKLTALFNYQTNPFLADLIKTFKYDFARETQEIWRDIFDKVKIKLETDLIIPVPLHSRRLRERGFNQAEILAEIIFDILKQEGSAVELDKNLIRCRYTKQQAKLGGGQRKENLKDAFLWQGGNLFGKRILLIDDVFTTGATLNESAKVLKQAGALEVGACVLAKD